MLVWVACDRSVATRMSLCAFSKKKSGGKGDTYSRLWNKQTQKKTTQMLV